MQDRGRGCPGWPALERSAFWRDCQATRTAVLSGSQHRRTSSPRAAKVLLPGARSLGTRTQMIAVGEESGHLEDLCLRVADTYDGEVRRALRTTVALIEPAMILIFYGINLNAF